MRPMWIFCRLGQASYRHCFLWFVLAVSLGLTLVLPFLYSRKQKPITLVWPKNLTRNANDFILPLTSVSNVGPNVTCDISSSNNEISKEGEEDDDVYSSSSFSPRSNKLLVVVVVCSAVENLEERRTIRQTWASPSHTPSDVKVVFLVGRSLNSTVQEEILSESAHFADVIQEDFIDSYANLTVKSLMMLKWFTRNCDGGGVPYVMKTDDDMYINLERLRDHAAAAAASSKDADLPLLHGSLICGAVPIRDPANKWFAPEYMFTSAVYPNYLSGTAYLLSRSAAERLLEASAETPIFHLEDIYVTGILAKSVGIRPADDVGFSYVKRQLSPCLYSQTISSHHLTPEEMREISTKLLAAAGKKMKCKVLRKQHLRTYGPGKCKWK